MFKENLAGSMQPDQPMGTSSPCELLVSSMNLNPTLLSLAVTAGQHPIQGVSEETSSLDDREEYNK
jgi:hypothetical protein